MDTIEPAGDVGGHTVDIKPDVLLPGGMTQADVHAQGADLSETDVFSANAAAAPPDEIRQSLLALHARMSAVENLLGTGAENLAGVISGAGPSAETISARLSMIEGWLDRNVGVISDAARVGGELVPAAAPALGNVAHLATVVEGILTALHGVLGQKAPSSLPPAGSTSKQPLPVSTAA